MRDGQTSQDLLQMLWEAIRKTSCGDAEEQLKWVLTCFTSHHVNSEVRKAFELNPPETEAGALAIVDDVESKQQECKATERVNNACKETDGLPSPNKISAVNTHRQGNRRNFGGRFCGNGAFRANERNECNACGGTSRCRNGQCPAVNAECYECSKMGHLAKCCPLRRQRAGGNAA
jgi:hypothetical protein